MPRTKPPRSSQKQPGPTTPRKESKTAVTDPYLGDEVFRTDLGSGKTLHVSKGDLTRIGTDAIVDPANGELQAGGGLSRALVKHGGDVIQQESNEWVKTHGRAGPRKVAVTSAGSLPAKYIIHTVGPRWQDGQHGELEDIFDAYRSAIDKADELGLSSVALPSIGTGIFLVPKPIGANAAMMAVKRFVADHPKSSVTEIHLVNNDDPTVEAMTLAAIQHFGSAP